MCATIETLGQLFDCVRRWESQFFSTGLGYPMVWYRGQADSSWELQPTVLRRWFVQHVLDEEGLTPRQVRLAQRERTINNQFRRMAASLLPTGASSVDIYFLAQHHGMPTRLLDWTTSALVGLFFAVNSQANANGSLLVMNPRFLIPDHSGDPSSAYPPDVVDVRARIVAEAIGPLFGEEGRFAHPFILPIQPDLRAGRMLQQSSCFTLHMPPPVVRPSAGTPVDEPFLHIRAINRTFEQYMIPSAAKPDLLIDLRRSGINYATIYPDLDNIAREIRTAWRLYS